MKRAFTVILLFIFSVGASRVSAEVIGDRIKPFLSVRNTYDSNIFRVKDKEQVKSVTGDYQLSDFVTNVSVGVNLNYQLSRQEVNVLLKKDLVRYSHYSVQDASQEEINVAFALKAFDRISARINGGYTNTLVPKESYLTNQQDKQLNKNIGVLLNYAMPSGFLIQTEARHERLDYSNKSLDYRESTNKSYTGILFYSPSSDKNYYIGYQRNYLDFDLPQPMAGILVNNNSTGDTMKIGLNREIGSRVVLSLNAGYTSRKYDEFSARNFHGIIGKTELHYKITDKITLSADIERKLSEELSLNQTYSVHDVLGLTASYRPTVKIETYLRGSAGEKTFEGSANLFASSLPPRKDYLREIRTGVSWTPIRRLSADVLYRYSSRSSSLDVYNYTSQGAELGLSYKF